MISPEESGLSSWPESVNYLLCNYAQSTHIEAAINDVRAVRRSQYESRNDLAKRISDEIGKFANVPAQKAMQFELARSRIIRPPIIHQRSSQSTSSSRYPIIIFNPKRKRGNTESINLIQGTEWHQDCQSPSLSSSSDGDNVLALPNSG